jgi:ABC-type multidrug transport system ATPase subunit
VTAAIEVRALTRRFGSTVAIDGMDLVVERGETVVLAGPNGCGKTTLLRLIGGAIEPDSGTILVGGRDVVHERIAARALTGVMFGGDRAWYPRLTGRENLEFFARLEALGRRAPELVEAALASVGLEDAGDRQVRGYSSGMQARLALARARLAQPEALLLDEPTATLDARSTKELRERIERPEGRRAVLMATHDAEEAAAVADRILVIRGGRVACELPGSVSPDALRRELAA